MVVLIVPFAKVRTMQSTLIIDAPDVLVSSEGSSLVTEVSKAWLLRIVQSSVPVLILRAGAHDQQLREDMGIADGLHFIAGDSLPGLGAMMRLLQDYGADLSEAWWLSADQTSFRLAGSIGCGSGVLLGADEVPTGLGLRVVVARDFADAPRVMIPARGGCWHDHDQS